MKITRAVERTDEGQADCFWHDHSGSLRYVLVLQGVVSGPTENAAMVAMAQVGGRVTSISGSYDYLSVQEPGLLPWENGPCTVLLIL